MVDYDAVIAWSNLLEASRRARRGRRRSPAIARHEYHLEADLLALHAELAAGTYRPGRYHRFWVHDPKRRLIAAATVRDRVVHHALCNRLEPVLDRTFVASSFANRCGKGTHRALDRCQTLSRRFRYVLQCDVRQYFASIDHAILVRELFRRVSDPRTRRLIQLIVDGGRAVAAGDFEMVYFAGDGLFAAARPRGLPIGNLTSQIWANCYLNPFDHFVVRELRCAGYLRYVDDFLLFAADKRVLWSWKAAIEARLARLRLVIHPGAHPRPVTEGIPFLGFVVSPERRRLKGRKVTHFARRLRRRLRGGGPADADRARFDASVTSWLAHASHADTRGLQAVLLRQHGLHPTGSSSVIRYPLPGAGTDSGNRP